MSIEISSNKFSVTVSYIDYDEDDDGIEKEVSFGYGELPELIAGLQTALDIRRHNEMMNRDYRALQAWNGAVVRSYAPNGG